MIELTCPGVDLRLAAQGVRTADPDVLVGAAETAHDMALEMGQDKERIIAQQVAADRDLRDPLGPRDRKHGGAFLIHDIDRAEGPAVMSDRLAVLFGRIAVAGIEGIGINDLCVLQFRLLFDQVLHPGSGDDIGAVLLTGVEFDCHLPDHISVDFVVDFPESFRREVTRKIHNRFIPGSLFDRNIFLPACPRSLLRNHFYICHPVSSCF